MSQTEKKENKLQQFREKCAPGMKKTGEVRTGGVHPGKQEVRCLGIYL